MWFLAKKRLKSIPFCIRYGILFETNGLWIKRARNADEWFESHFFIHWKFPLLQDLCPLKNIFFFNLKLTQCVTGFQKWVATEVMYITWWVQWRFINKMSNNCFLSTENFPLFQIPFVQGKSKIIIHYSYHESFNYLCFFSFSFFYGLLKDELWMQSSVFKRNREEIINVQFLWDFYYRLCKFFSIQILKY